MDIRDYIRSHRYLRDLDADEVVLYGRGVIHSLRRGETSHFDFIPVQYIEGVVANPRGQPTLVWSAELAAPIEMTFGKWEHNLELRLRDSSVIVSRSGEMYSL